MASHGRTGYAETARFQGACHKFNRFIDIVLMQKFLT